MTEWGQTGKFSKYLPEDKSAKTQQRVNPNHPPSYYATESMRVQFLILISNFHSEKFNRNIKLNFSINKFQSATIFKRMQTKKKSKIEEKQRWN